MKIFISMPMKSKSTEQVRAEMTKVKEYIEEKLEFCEFIDSIIDGADREIALKGNDVALWYLGKSILLLSQADLVFFVNDWKDYRGCSAERKIAEEYGKFCIDIKVNLSVK